MPIKPISSIHILAALLAAASLAACANPRSDQDHGQHHPAQSGATTTVPNPSGVSSEQGGMMDRNMQAMPPEMRQRHMEMMRRQCQCQ